MAPGLSTRVRGETGGSGYTWTLRASARSGMLTPHPEMLVTPRAFAGHTQPLRHLPGRDQPCGPSVGAGRPGEAGPLRGASPSSGSLWVCPGPPSSEDGGGADSDPADCPPAPEALPSPPGSTFESPPPGGSVGATPRGRGSCLGDFRSAAFFCAQEPRFREASCRPVLSGRPRCSPRSFCPLQASVRLPRGARPAPPPVLGPQAPTRRAQELPVAFSCSLPCLPVTRCPRSTTCAWGPAPSSCSRDTGAGDTGPLGHGRGL